MYPLIIYLLGYLTAAANKNEKDEHKHFDLETYKGKCKFPAFPNPVMSSPSAPTDEERSEKKKDDTRKAIKFWAELIGIVILLAYTTFTILIWCANKKAAEAAKSAADTAHDALITSERPWVIVTITLEEPPHAHSLGPSLTFNADGSATLNAFVVVKNIGHSPATSIYIRPQMYPPPFEEVFTGPSEKQRAWCDKVRVEKPVMPMLPSLMPGEEDTENFSLQMSKQDVQTAMQSPAFSGMQSVIPVIYGCVNYTSGLFEGVRQTPFMYELAPVRTTPGTIPASKLEVIKLFRGKAPD